MAVTAILIPRYDIAPMGFTVFYAWQSDRDERACRYLIRDAARAAIKRLAAEGRLAEAPALDHDTKDEPGTPHIAETIRRKIRRCGVFVADLTYVSNYRTSDGRKKRAPNANVLVELGLAIREVGWSRIILVMNVAHGPPEDLPFDLKHHSFPVLFKFEDGDDRKSVRDQLSASLLAKLALIVKSGAIEDAAIRKQLEVSITCRKGETPSQQHVRWLVVDLVNSGIALNDVYVTMEYSDKAGKPTVHEMTSVGDVPNPFVRGFSCRFAVYNDDPSRPLEALVDLPAEGISVAVHSRIRTVAKIPATKWADALEAFRQPDATLPRKPPPPRNDPGDYHGWVTRYRSRY